MGWRGQAAAQAQQRAPSTQYRQNQSCFLDELTGEVIVKFYKTEVVKVKPSGEVRLDSGGFHNPSTFASLNDALNLIGIRVIANGDVKQGNWSVSDGRTLARFSDGMVLAAKGVLTQNRGEVILQAFKHPHASAALSATAASTAAAAAAGLLPAAQLPQRYSYETHNNGQTNGQAVLAGSDYASKSQDLVRRLKAQGRYVPY